MPLGSQSWQEITPSRYVWEREALAFLRERLPDHEPYRAFANFEFVATDGSINEVDVLIVAPRGCFLVEIKSWPGEIRGDGAEWLWIHGGRRKSVENPLLLANKKAKRLKSILERNWPRGNRSTSFLPFIQPLVFLSAEAVNVQLDPVLLRDVVTRKNVLEALTSVSQEVWNSPKFHRVDKPTSKAIKQALDKQSIKARERRIGEYRLQELTSDGDAWQEWIGIHTSVESVKKLVRVYKVEMGFESGKDGAADVERRAVIRRGAEREFRILQGAVHPGIQRAEHFAESELGPALFFEHAESDERLDRFLAERGEKLSFDQRLGLLRQIAEAVAYAHGQKLVHRSLSPAAIVVRNPDSDKHRVIIGHWQVSARFSGADSSGVTTSRSRLTATAHISAFVGNAASAYLAPEIDTTPDADDPRLDVFSLGAIAYFLFSGKAPGTSLLDVREKLLEHEGLRIESAVDGVPDLLAELIREATDPNVTRRTASVRKFQDDLDAIEEELTRPADPVLPDVALDPGNAKVGERLISHELDYRVNKRLGSGSSAVAYLVATDGGDPSSERVLKVALDPSHNDRLRGEGEVLAKLRHPAIVRFHETIELGRPATHVALLLDRAGEETLGDRLSKEGSLSVDLLERFGSDLLNAALYLEREGVLHRDIKPDNLGVARQGKNAEEHLVLIDFSLSRTSPEQTEAGTRAYLDPFLALKDPRSPTRSKRPYDFHAERFAAAMTLHEMATGVLPKWGDGLSRPELLECEVTVESDRLPAELRRRLSDFFKKALARRIEDRFGNAEDMAAAWKRAFAAAPKTEQETRRDLAAQEAAVEAASLETTLGELLLSTRAQNALDRAGVIDVRSLLALPSGEFFRIRGVGSKTRDEILRIVRTLRERLGSPPAAPARSSRAPARRKGGTRAAGETDSVAEGPAPHSEDLDLSIDRLAELILRGKASPGRRAAKKAEVLPWLLGIRPLPDTLLVRTPLWPSLVEVGKAAGLTPPAIGAVLANQRQAWAKLPAIERLRDDVVKLVASLSGVALIDELIEKIVPERGFHSSDADERRRHGAAVLRAAIETEAKGEDDESERSPRLVFERHDGKVFVALDGADPNHLTGLRVRDGARAIAAVRRLARLADAIASEAAEADLLTPEATLARFRGAYDSTHLPDAPLPRLVKLAVLVSERAALSSRLEIYPRGLDSARAVRLAHGAFAGMTELTVDEITARVRGRYPECAPLPPRPELDRLLASAGFEFTFDPSRKGGKGAFVAPDARRRTISSDSTRASRHATAHGDLARRPRPASAEESEEIAAARAFESKIGRAFAEGAFLALAADEGAVLDAEAELKRRFPELVVRSFDRLLIDAMRAQAQKFGADWEVVLAADAAPADSEDGRRLRLLVATAVRELEEQLPVSERTTLLTDLGLLARYDRIDLLERLRDRVAVRPSADDPGLFGLWLLVPCDGLAEAPRIDDRAIPVVTRAQWARVPEAWIRNLHRGVPAPAGAAS